MSEVFRALASVNTAAIEHNCALLRGKLSGDTELCAVVKADGYGHGAVEVARAALAGGATWLAVVSAQEAAKLRAAGIEVRLLVMGALSPSELKLALVQDADLVVWREAFLAELIARAGGTVVRVHIKLDTGMGRLGTRDPAEAELLAERVATANETELVGVMTHFATADDLQSDFLTEQLERFTPFAQQLKERYPAIKVHAANSAATLREPATHFDMVRCGIAVYGMDPFGKDPAEHGLRPVLQLSSYVADVKSCSPGDSVGYGRRFIAQRQTSIAVLPIGYGDGVRRALTNNADVLIAGRRYPLVGTVSMDNITVDLGADSEVRVGDEAVLIGQQAEEQILAEEWAERLATINYEITCGIAARVSRRYEDG